MLPHFIHAPCPLHPPMPQVDSVRSELGAEVQALLGTIERKSAKLADAEARLTGRLRWGVAMIQAKSEAAAKRRAFMWWRCAGPWVAVHLSCLASWAVDACMHQLCFAATCAQLPIRLPYAMVQVASRTQAVWAPRGGQAAAA